MKTILLPECLLIKFGISKTNWPKVICLSSVIHRNSKGRILDEFFIFEFHGVRYSLFNVYNSKRCVESQLFCLSVVEPLSSELISDYLKNN